jgi:hypothetical protein
MNSIQSLKFLLKYSPCAACNRLALPIDKKAQKVIVAARAALDATGMQADIEKLSKSISDRVKEITKG